MKQMRVNASKNIVQRLYKAGLIVMATLSQDAGKLHGNTKKGANLKHLTEEQQTQLDDALGEVMANQFGAVILVVCEGKPDLIKIEQSERLTRPVRQPFTSTILSKQIGCK
ncbi:MAG: hypothetical protein P4L50_24675 [Anaerolineaceae bacterium]|nr:hypothetical protein [Anaerolineaceae bacterium]